MSAFTKALLISWFLTTTATFSTALASDTHKLYDQHSESDWARILKMQRDTLTKVPPEQWLWITKKLGSKLVEDHQIGLRVLSLTLQHSIIETPYYEAITGDKRGYSSPLHEFLKTIDIKKHSEGLVAIARNLNRERQKMLIIGVGNLQLNEHKGARAFLNNRYIQGITKILLYNQFQRISKMNQIELGLQNHDRTIALLEYALAIRSGPGHAWGSAFTAIGRSNIAENAIANVFKNGSLELKTAVMEMILERYSQHSLRDRDFIEQNSSSIKIENRLPDRIFALALHDPSGSSAAYFAAKSDYARWVFEEMGKPRFDEETLRTIGLKASAGTAALSECRKLLKATSEHS
jgi:hypothetical protein